VALEDGKYMLLTTFRRDGTPVATPVWLVALGSGELGFWTSSGSGKAKRIAHTARVTVQPCDARGRSNGTPTEATARLVTGAEYEDIHRRVVEKYGFQTKLTKVVGTVLTTLKGKRLPYGDAGVVVTLASSSA
jgi:uncharacterized protein